MFGTCLELREKNSYIDSYVYVAVFFLQFRSLSMYSTKMITGCTFKIDYPKSKKVPKDSVASSCEPQTTTN